MSVYDTQSDDTRDESLQAATDAVRDGRLIVLPTDTVYGIGADAFDPAAVQALLDAKGRGRSVPPPVLVGDSAVLLALADDVPDYAERLAEEFWPGALTLVLRAQPTLSWDLGETRGTVALRMPDDATALELLRRTGPLAVSSANRHGKPAATTVLDAATQLGDSVEVYLDGGTARLGTSSTIIDTTVEPAEILREGAITREEIIAAVGDIFTAPEPEPEPEADVVTDATAAGTDADATDADPDGSEDAVGSAPQPEDQGSEPVRDLEDPEPPAAPAETDAADPEAPADAPDVDPEAPADAPAADPEAPADVPALDPATEDGAPVVAPAALSDSDAPSTASTADAASDAAPDDAATASAPGEDRAAGQAPTAGPLDLPSEADAAPGTEGRIG